MLSIIIPFYGNANQRLLNRCIHSIQNQNLPQDSYEIIVADDNGKEVGGARNNGMTQAKGDYILFIDADDYLFDDVLVPMLETIREEQPDILSFNYQLVYDEHAMPSELTIVNKTYDTGAEYMLTHNFMGTVWRHFYRRELLEKNHLHFDENAFHEDEAFVVMAYFFAQKTIITNRVAYAYVQLSSSILHRKEKVQRIKRLDGFYGCLRYLQQFSQSNKLRVSNQQLDALQRRIRFLTIDYVFQMFRNHCSPSDFGRRIVQLKTQGYLPLPAAGYSYKYRLARLLINAMILF